MTYDTMSEAIAMSSPSGKMSNRARRAASARLQAAFDAERAAIPIDTKALVGRKRLDRITQVTSQIKWLQGFVDIGYRKRAHSKEVARLVAELTKLEN